LIGLVIKVNKMFFHTKLKVNALLHWSCFYYYSKEVLFHTKKSRFIYEKLDVFNSFLHKRPSLAWPTLILGLKRLF